MRRICLYHGADLDGFCSGAIYDKYFTEKASTLNNYEGHEIIPMNYGWEVPWEKLERAHVTLIDFCLQPWSEMERLMGIAGTVVLIDHHQTTIENWNTSLDTVKWDMCKVKAVLDEMKAGCELAWEYYYPEFLMPTAVKLLGRYDVWDHSNERALPFQYGMRNYDMRPDVGEKKWMWDDLLNFAAGQDLIRKLCDEGSIILKYQSRQDEIGSKSTAFEIEWEGLNWVVSNSGMGRGSHFFDAVYDPEVHDGMMAFCFNGKEWKFALYSTKVKVQCGQIAKRYGGGGHNGAAGFSYFDIPFQLIGAKQIEKKEDE